MKWTSAVLIGSFCLFGSYGIANAGDITLSTTFLHSENHDESTSGAVLLRVTNHGPAVRNLDIRSANGLVNLDGNGVAQLGPVASGGSAQVQVNLTVFSALIEEGAPVDWRIDYVDASGANATTIIHSSF
jgi:hypothetical protein